MRRARFSCIKCDVEYHVLGDVELLRKTLELQPECPVCEHGLVLGLKQSVVREFTADEFWKAVHGFGFPDEVVAGVEALEALLLAHRVESVDAIETRTGRVELRSLTLANGVKLHLAASGEGAVIFKATKEMQDDSES